MSRILRASPIRRPRRIPRPRIGQRHLVVCSSVDWFVVRMIEKHLPVVAVGRGVLVCFAQDLIASELVNALPVEHEASDDH